MKKAKHDDMGRNLGAVFERCRWCQRQPVKLKRGRLVSHLTPGGLRCFGIGQPARPLSTNEGTQP